MIMSCVEVKSGGIVSNNWQKELISEKKKYVPWELSSALNPTASTGTDLEYRL